MCECDAPKVQVQIDGAAVEVDACLAGLVAALNAAGNRTFACCCGHGVRPGRVILLDGREIEIHPFSEDRLRRCGDLIGALDVQRLTGEV